MKDLFHWLPDRIRQSAWATLSGKKVEKVTAQSFLAQLEKSSQDRIVSSVGPSFYKKNFPVAAKGPKWKDGKPIGVVDHYTASLKLTGTLSWFSKAHPEANVSSHFVIDRDGAIVMLVNPLEEVAWHARGFNSEHIGIEHVNAGLLKKFEGNFFYLDRLLYPKERLHLIQESNKEYWEPYTSYQVAASIVLKRWLIEAIPTLMRERFTDHNHLDPDRKRDCGPLWPLDNLNNLVFLWQDGYRFSWAGKEDLALADVQTFTAEMYKHA